MTPRRSESDHGINAEPHLTGLHAPGPPAQGGVDEEPAHTGRTETDAFIGDEPALAWRGADKARAYGAYVARRAAATPPFLKWSAVAGAAAVAGPLAIVGAFLHVLTAGAGFGLLAVIVVGPAVEEVLKVAFLFYLVERRPWLLPGYASVIVVAVMGGLGFAAVENWIYLNVYFPDHSAGLAYWRWTVNVAVHCGCSAIAGLGIARLWRQVAVEARTPETGITFAYFLAAILIHGAYNAFAVLLGIIGLEP